MAATILHRTQNCLLKFSHILARTPAPRLDFLKSSEHVGRTGCHVCANPATSCPCSEQNAGLRLQFLHDGFQTTHIKLQADGFIQDCPSEPLALPTLATGATPLTLMQEAGVSNLVQSLRPTVDAQMLSENFWCSSTAALRRHEYCGCFSFCSEGSSSSVLNKQTLTQEANPRPRSEILTDNGCETCLLR